jgi:glycosyltransferase involved in cell wall biosynthesis
VAGYLKEAFDQIDVPVTHHNDPMPHKWALKDTVELWWGNPKDWQWSRKKVKLRVGFCLSEARSILAFGRDVALENLSKCDFIICPSWHSAQAYLESPLDMPVHVVPLGLDPEEFTFVNRDWSITLMFLHIGVSQFRKGSWMVPEAFVRAFPKETNVHLTIASAISNRPMYQQLKKEYGKHPRISFQSHFKSSAMEYYKRHHVLVSPHLSEGWGLCIPEALATGMTALVARCSSPLEFFKKDYGWWIEMSELYAPVNGCLPDTGGLWRLPDVDSLANVMLEAHKNRTQCMQKGIHASKVFRECFTWNITAERIKELIDVYPATKTK